MARRPRQHYRGAFYHFIARGNNRQPIFLGVHDRWAFQRYLRDGVKRFGYRCHAYCWMTNHVHMAIEVADVPLSQIAHNLLFRYARWFHQGHGRTGHLFERRYRAFVVESDEALLSLVRYIHLNPVRAEVVDGPAAYPWSSYSAYLDLGSRPPSWLTRRFVLSLFATDTSVAQAAFRTFSEGGSEGNEEGAKSRQQPVITPAGRESAVEGTLMTNAHGTPSQHPVPCKVTLDQILQAVCSVCALQRSELRANVQSRAIVKARSLASFLVHKNCGSTFEELSAAVGRDASTLSRAAKNTAGRLAQDAELRSCLERIQDQLGGN